MQIETILQYDLLKTIVIIVETIFIVAILYLKDK